MPSTASEWLAERPGALAEFEEMLADSGLPLDVLTEYPDWMKQSVADRLVETFEQPYWDDIAETFSGDAERWLQAGLRDGLSIRQMAQRMSQDFSGGSYKYAVNRATNIARTEAGHALNAARKDGMNRLMADVQSQLDPRMGGVMRPVWLSVLGTTTRDSHADLDGVPADKDGMWELAGYRIPWPGHISLPPSERCNCQCTIGMDYGLRDEHAQELIEGYHRREEQRLQSEEEQESRRREREEAQEQDEYDSAWAEDLVIETTEQLDEVQRILSDVEENMGERTAGESRSILMRLQERLAAINEALYQLGNYIEEGFDPEQVLSPKIGANAEKFSVLSERVEELLVELQGKKHLQGRHNQLSHGRGGGAQMSPDAGSSFGGGGEEQKLLLGPDGNPLLLYRGGEPSEDGPVFLTTSQSGATEYTSEGEAVGEFYISMENPLELVDTGTSPELVEIAEKVGINDFVKYPAGDVYSETLEGLGPSEQGNHLPDLLYSKAVREELAKRGYDGLHFQDVLYGGYIDTYAVLSKKQLVRPEKGEKHLQGRHNQLSHGRGGSSSLHAMHEYEIEGIEDISLNSGASKSPAGKKILAMAEKGLDARDRSARIKKKRELLKKKIEEIALEDPGRAKRLQSKIDTDMEIELQQQRKLSPGKRKLYMEAMEEALDRMPEEAVELMLHGVDHIEFRNSTRMITEEAKLEARMMKSRGWDDAGDDGVGGFYDGVTRTLVLDSVPRGIGLNKEHMKQLYLHEMVHAIDYGYMRKHGNYEEPYSSTEDWYQRSMTEVVVPTLRQQRAVLTHYAMASPQEAFAEFGRVLYMNPDEATAEFPMMSEAFDAMDISPLI